MKRRGMWRTGAVLCAMVASCLAGPRVEAQTFPSKPVTLIVPIGAGSAIDVVARVVANKVSENWGQKMIVENRPGAAAAIGMDAGAKAAPDGYTLTIAGTSQLLSPLVSKVRYDIVRDFTAVSLSGIMPYVLAVPGAFPANSLNDLVAMAKAKPGTLNYAALIGSVPHLMGEGFKVARGLDIVMVPYNSTTDAQADVLTGRVEIWLTPMASSLAFAKSGKIKVLGVAGERQPTLLPNVPTMAEAGYPELDASVALFIMAPQGTPKPIVADLNREIVKAMEARDVRERFSAAGIEPKSSTPEALDAMLRSEMTRWGKVIKDSGFKPQ